MNTARLAPTGQATALAAGASGGPMKTARLAPTGQATALLLVLAVAR